MNNKVSTIDSGMLAQVPGAQAAGYAARSTAAKRAVSLFATVLGALVVMVLVAVAAVAILFAGFGNVFGKLATVTVGDLRIEAHSVPLPGSGPVAVNVEMGGGTLVLSGGATDLLNADFTYNVDQWNPEVTLHEATLTSGGTERTLNITQPNTDGFFRIPDGVRNEWNLRLNDGVPMTLSAQLGAGVSIIKLGGVSVSKFDISAGAAEVTLDLTGIWKQNLRGTVDAGIGNVTVRIPRNVGVDFNIEGIGTVNSGGLSKDGTHYRNAAYGKTPVTLEINVETGIGTVNIESER